MAPQPDPNQLELDHFLFYEIEPSAIGEKINLQGQFDELRLDAHVERLTHFANPVSKNEEGILNRFAHLKTYSIDTVSEPKRIVKVHNQFGEWKYELDQPALLLAPAEKHEPGSEPPKYLDHFKCYKISNQDPAERSVSLKDQFAFYPEVKVGDALYFGVPVRKRHDNTITEIVNERAHLTIYGVDQFPAEQKRKATDQFGTHPIIPRRLAFLGLPTLKLHWALA